MSVVDDPALRLLTLYDSALPQVYGYLLARCGGQGLAEDLAAETFLAAVDSARRPGAPAPSVRWLIGIARHKLVDHWRAEERERKRIQAIAAEPTYPEDPWECRLDVLRAHEVLGALGAHHRSALTLRYLDGLSVPAVAAELDRTVHATEALLIRAKAAFRAEYEKGVQR